MNKQLIISIGREYGSGGHEIGRMLAEKLDIPFYDRNLLDEVANIKQVDADNLYKYDEAPHRAFLSRRVRGYSNSPEENVAEMQFALLKQKAADEDSFVIVGRCSDEIFKGIAPCLSIFIRGEQAVKVKRIMEIRKMSEREASRAIERHDRHRRSYHNHFCSGKWGESSSYDICINSSRLGLEATADMLYDMVVNYINKD